MLKLLFVPALAALALASAAQADMVSYTSAPFSGGSSLTAQVPQFDPSLGTLTGVSLQFSGHVTPTVSILQISGGAAVVSAFTNTDGTNPVGGPTSPATPMSLADAYGGSTAIASYAASMMGVSLPAGGAFTVTSFPMPASAVSASLLSTVPGGSLAAFLGLGTNPVAYSTSGDIHSGGSVISGAGDIGFGGGRVTDGAVTVTYTFSVPAPGSAAGVMGLGLMAARRRRR